MPRIDKLEDLQRKFIELLDVEELEQVYQRFLEENSRLIPREFIQNHGLHFDLVLRKLSLARDYTTDFFYLAKSSANWHCVLVEIEKPQSRYFKDGGHELHKDFSAALEQISSWRAWFAERANFDHFINSTIKALRVPITMTANPCHIKYVLVHGRRAEFESNDMRRKLIAAQERDDFHILSFDSLLESLHTKRDLYVAIRTNENFQIISDQFAGESLFSWMPPEQLRLNPSLRSDILSHRDEWYHRRDLNTFVLDDALPKILNA